MKAEIVSFASSRLQQSSWNCQCFPMLIMSFNIIFVINSYHHLGTDL